MLDDVVLSQDVATVVFMTLEGCVLHSLTLEDMLRVSADRLAGEVGSLLIVPSC